MRSQFDSGGVSMVSRMRFPVVGSTLLVALFSATVAAETKLPAKTDFHLYLLVGQSNMAGRGRVSAEDRQPIPGVLTFDGIP